MARGPLRKGDLSEAKATDLQGICKLRGRTATVAALLLVTALAHLPAVVGIEAMPLSQRQHETLYPLTAPRCSLQMSAKRRPTNDLKLHRDSSPTLATRKPCARALYDQVPRAPVPHAPALPGPVPCAAGLGPQAPTPPCPAPSRSLRILPTFVLLCQEPVIGHQKRLKQWPMLV